MPLIGDQGFTLVPPGYPEASSRGHSRGQFFRGHSRGRFDMEFSCGMYINLPEFCLQFLGPWMALNDGQDVQGGQGLTLVPLGHPGAVFEAVI